MLEAGVTPKEIFEAFTSEDKTAPTLAGYMKGTAEAEKILDGYVSYWVDCDSPKGLTNVTVAYDEATDAYTVTLATEYAIKDTDLFDVLDAADSSLKNSATVVRTTEDWSSGTENLTDLPSKMSSMITKVLAGTDYTLTVTIGDIIYTVILTAAAE